MKKPTFSLNMRRWRSATVGAGMLAAMSALYLVQLAWPGKLAAPETAALANGTFSTILHDPLNWPYKLLEFAWLQTPLRETVSARLPAVMLALAAVAVFYFLARRWYGKVSATYAAIIFATSTWLLYSGRLGTAQIMLVLVPLSLLLLASWLNATEHHSRALLLFALVSSMAVFTPGGTWFVAAVCVLLCSILGEHFRGANAKSKTAAVAIFLLSAGALAYTFVQNLALARSWLGLPAHFGSALNILQEWLNSILYLAVRGPEMSGAWLAHTPVLDVATTVLLLAGILLYRKHLGSLRTRLLITFFGVGSVLIALNGSAALGYVVGIAYLVATTGLAYFQHKWFKIFPLNPLARGLAIGLVVLLVAAIVTFHTQRYFIAWQRSAVTQQFFQESSTPRTDLVQ